MALQVYQEIPTIREHPFVPQDDGKALRTAMKGRGTNEAAIINILTKRTQVQRLQIAQSYKDLFGRDLVKDLEEETSGWFRKILIALMTPVYEMGASAVHDAVARLGTKEKVLMDVLCPASNQDIRGIKAAYQKLYTNQLETDVKADVSGSFSEFMMAICGAGRDENTKMEPGVDTQDAPNLMAAGIKKIGTDESAFIRILTSRSYQHLRTVFQEYHKLSGQDIEESIKSEFSSDIKDGLITVVKCAKNRAAYFAERLKAAMAGMGVKHKQLIYIIVTRAEVDLESIKIEYQKMYGRSMADDIQAETSGDFRKTLMALCAF